MDREAHCQRSPEAQMVEGVQRDATQGRKPEKPRKGRSFTNFDRRIFYTQHQSPYFRVWILNEGSIEKFLQPKLLPQFSYTAVLRYFGIWRMGAGVFSNRGDPKRFFSKFLLERCSRYGAIIILSVISRLPR